MKNNNVNNEEKMHLMISSKASEISWETKAVNVYNSTMEKYNFRAIQTINDAMRNESPCLVSMRGDVVKRGGDPALVDNVLKLMIAKTARAFNLTRNIEPAQIGDLVEDLQQEFFYLKLSEVFFVLKQARMGRLGKTYERLDQPTIMQWFENYAEERLTISETESMQVHEQSTHTEKDRKYDGFILNLQREQSNEEQTKIKNIAYKMAKKMNANNVNNTIRSNETVAKIPETQSEKSKYSMAKTLKEKGVGYDEIAKEIGYESKGSVSKLFEKAKTNGW
jgi:hypothetical protein